MHIPNLGGVHILFATKQNLKLNQFNRSEQSCITVKELPVATTLLIDAVSPCQAPKPTA